MKIHINIWTAVGSCDFSLNTPRKYSYIRRNKVWSRRNVKIAQQNVDATSINAFHIAGDEKSDLIQAIRLLSLSLE